MIELLYHDGELSKKYLKKGEKLARENLGAVKGRIDKAFFSKGKSVSQEHKPLNKSVIDTEKMDDFLKFSDDDEEEEEEGKSPFTRRSNEPLSSSKRPSSSSSHFSKRVEIHSSNFDVNPSSNLVGSQSPERCSNQSGASNEAESDEMSFETSKQTRRNLMNEYDNNVIPPKEISLNDDEVLQLLAEAENNDADELTDTEISQLLEMKIEGEATKEAKTSSIANEKESIKPKIAIESTENEDNFDSLIDEINEGWFSSPRANCRV